MVGANRYPRNESVEIHPARSEESTRQVLDPKFGIFAFLLVIWCRKVTLCNFPSFSILKVQVHDDLLHHSAYAWEKMSPRM
jgi:hypothetical protein